MAAIEHMKWNQVLQPAAPFSVSQHDLHLRGEESEGESDEEIVRLKNKIQVFILYTAL